MTTAAIASSRIQTPVLLVAGAVIALLFVHLLGYGARHATLLLIGVALGVTLYHGAFGFAGAYRRAVVDGDVSPIIAQLVMLALAIVLFAPVLALGTAFDRPVVGAVAPVGVSMALGALLFGIGMQLAGGCASGTLYTAGGGNLRMAVVLVFFCVGGFWASLDFDWWAGLPGIGAVSLSETFGWPAAVAGQLLVLAGIYGLLRRMGGPSRRPSSWRHEFSWQRLLRGPWPLLPCAALLALLNWMTLLVAGHPWSITWAFALWPAKIAQALGWNPATSAFWTGDFQRAALAAPVFADTVSVMNIGILLGAFVAASLAGRIAPTLHISRASLAASVVGGLMLGYGARLAYGCNIGAFFSGVASASLHGWVWIVAAAFGTMIGVRLRPLFRLPR